MDSQQARQLNDLSSKALPGGTGYLFLTILTMEELAELTQALSKSLRGLYNDPSLAKDVCWLKMIVEEVADVEIMLSRLVEKYDIRADVNEVKKQKIKRTLQRLSSLK